MTQHRILLRGAALTALTTALSLPVASQTVTSFTVVNADTDADISTQTSTATVSLTKTPRINVRANTAGAASVIFSGTAGSSIESTAPFSLKGDRNGDYFAWAAPAGTYTIKAVPYSAAGVAGTPSSLTLTVTSGAGTPVVSHAYPTNEGPDRNPHKGWNSSWDNAQPESSVGFQYLAWKDFEPTKGFFDREKVEQILAKPGTSGQHFVLRLFCEWDTKNVESDCPHWLYSEMGVKRLSGDEGRAMTDFNDPKFVDRAVLAIQELAKLYDGDARVHAFQIGVLGCWGEWHECGFKRNGVEYKINDTSKSRVLQAYKSNFKKSPLQGRYPWAEPLKSAGFIGFHNDFFVPNDGHSNEFDSTLASLGGWRNGPIGGEVPPREPNQFPSERAALYTTHVGQTMIETGHYSTMSPGAYRVPKTDPYYSEYMRLHRLMGYNFRIDHAMFADVVSATQTTMTLRLDGRNVGVARLFRPWDAEFALLDAQGKVASLAAATATVGLGEVAPGGTFSLSASLSRSGLAAGSYRLAVRLIQPQAGVAKTQSWGLNPRNAYILFANELPVIGAKWSANHALEGGWSVLGAVTLR